MFHLNFMPHIFGIDFKQHDYFLLFEEFNFEAKHLGTFSFQKQTVKIYFDTQYLSFIIRVFGKNATFYLLRSRVAIMSTVILPLCRPLALQKVSTQAPDAFIYPQNTGFDSEEMQMQQTPKPDRERSCCKTCEQSWSIITDSSGSEPFGRP